MKVNYICLDPGANPDGRGIYDKNLVRGLEAQGCVVQMIPLRVLGRELFSGPIWSLKVDPASLAGLDRKAFTILSHETVFSAAEAVRPDLLIAHNYPPNFLWPQNVLFQSAYRWRALGAFRRASKFSKQLLVLSERERRAAQAQLDIDVFAEPPGVRVDGAADLPIDVNLLRRSGSMDWMPKRRSLIKPEDLAKMRQGMPELQVADCEGKRGFLLIEDQFLSGFKLKLLDGLFRGDFVLSRADLADEIQWLGLAPTGFEHVPDWGRVALAPLQARFLAELPGDFVSSRAAFLAARFSWTEIAGRVLEKAA